MSIFGFEYKFDLEYTELARLLPSLKADVPGVYPWEPHWLDNWAARNPTRSLQALMSARFVLHQFHELANWQCGQFSIREARSCWDAAHWMAFQEYFRRAPALLNLPLELFLTPQVMWKGDSMTEVYRLACERCDRTDYDGVSQLPEDWENIDEAADSGGESQWWTHLGLCPDCKAMTQTHEEP